MSLKTLIVLKMLFLARLIPLCEHNYNLVELGLAEQAKLRLSGAFAAVILLTVLPQLPISFVTWRRQDGVGRHLGRLCIDEVADLRKCRKR